MNYLVFPFGKYKGEPLEELPSTYIVFALETFDLPKELTQKMGRILYGRLKIYSQMSDIMSEHINLTETPGRAIVSFLDFCRDRIEGYEG